jgi:glycosyltransferase involved in cell wall biosynthesis
VNKVILFGYSDAIGLTFHLTHLAIELYKEGCNILVIHNGKEQNPGLIQLLSQHHIEQFDISTHTLDWLLIQKSDELKNCIFHCQGFKQVLLCHRFKDRLKARIIVTMNAYRTGTWYRQIFAAYIQLKLKYIVDDWLFLSEFAYSDFTRLINIGLNAHKIPLGVDLIDAKINFMPPKTFYDQLSKQQITYDSNLSYIVFIAQFNKNKNHALLLEAFNYIKAEHSHARLILLGDGKLINEIEKFSVKLNLRDSVYFLGRVNRFEIGHYLKLAKLCLVLSNRETFGHNIVEPLALNIPTFSTNTGIAPEAIHHLENGFIFYRLNPKDIAQAINSYLHDNIKITGDLPNSYSWSNIARCYMNMYNS